jgi:hypothetical protein
VGDSEPVEATTDVVEVATGVLEDGDRVQRIRAAVLEVDLDAEDVVR